MNLTPQRIRRETPQRYRLEAGKCRGCGKVFFPPRIICSSCKGRDFETITLPMEGKVIAFTMIKTAPTGFSDEVPYGMAVVELDGGNRIMSYVADCEEEKLKIGLKVTIEFRRVRTVGDSGVLCYGYKCVPAG